MVICQDCVSFSLFQQTTHWNWFCIFLWFCNIIIHHYFLILTWWCSYNMLTFLLCVETAEVTPDCRGDLTRKKTQASHNRYFVWWCEEQAKPGSKLNWATALPIWPKWCRKPFALIGQPSPCPHPVHLALDESEHRGQRGCRKRWWSRRKDRCRN